MKKEHHIADQQIAQCNSRPQDDPLVRSLMQETDLMMHQYQVFGSQDVGVALSHGAGPSHDAGAGLSHGAGAGHSQKNF